MLRPWPAHAAVPFLIAALLAGCGGGGSGGGGGGGTTAPPAGPALAFTPATVTATANAGTSLTINVMAAVARPSDFSGATVFASVADSNGVILPSSTVVRDSDSQYHAVLQTSPTLAANNYKGSFSVRLCRDSACASQFPGSPVALPYDITVAPAGANPFSAVPAMPLSASAQAGGSAPAAVSVAIGAVGRSWTASNGGAAWLKLSATSGTGSASLSVSYDASGLAQGQYSTNLVISANDGQVVTLPVALTVLPPGLVLGSNSVTFNAINGAAIPTQVVSLDTDNKLTTNWSAASDAAWLAVSPTAGSTPATTVLTVDATIGKLASGSYQGNITITPQGLPVRTLPVTLNLNPATLATSATAITLGGDYGRDFAKGQDLALSLNTGTINWPWQLNGVPAWATVTAAAGTVNAAPASVTFKAKPANALVGVTPTLMTAVASVNGDTIRSSVLLSLNKDQHKLLPTETAVALVSMPGWNRLTRTITVADNYGSFGGMTASSDQSWLVVGVSNDKLILTADPSQLLADTVNTATITVSASDPDASAPEVIRVALWKGSAAPTAQVKTSLPYTNVAADPARPYAYLHNGGAVVDVYNVFTGAKEASITGFSAHLGDMAITPNGDTLYVVDIDNARLTAVNLATRAISKQLVLAAPGTKATRLKLIRPNGVEMLLLSDGQLFLTSTFQRVGILPLTSGGALAASSDGKRVVQQGEGSGAVQHTSVKVDYAALNSGTLFAAKQAQASHASPSTQGQDLWVTGSDDSDDNLKAMRVYSAAAAPKSCVVMNAKDLGIVGYLAVGDATPNNVKVAPDGRIFCGAAAKSSNNDIYMYDSTGARVIQQYKLSTTGKQLLPRQMVLSGEGWMVTAITDDGVVTFLPIGP